MHEILRRKVVGSEALNSPRCAMANPLYDRNLVGRGRSFTIVPSKKVALQRKGWPVTPAGGKARICGARRRHRMKHAACLHCCGQGDRPVVGGPSKACTAEVVVHEEQPITACAKLIGEDRCCAQRTRPCVQLWRLPLACRRFARRQAAGWPHWARHCRGRHSPERPRTEKELTTRNISFACFCIS